MDTSSRTPRVPQPATSGSSAPPSALDPAALAVSRTGPTHQQADTHSGTPGPCSQRPWALAPLPSRPTRALRHLGPLGQPHQEASLPTSRLTLDLGPPALQPPTLELGSAHQWASASPRTPRDLQPPYKAGPDNQLDHGPATPTKTPRAHQNGCFLKGKKDVLARMRRKGKPRALLAGT